MEIGTRRPAIKAPPGDPHGPRDDPSVLTQGECYELLRRATVGRIAYVIDGWPVVVPVNYLVDGDDIVVRTDPGTRLAAHARYTTQLGFEVDAPDMLFKSGWSVLAHGLAQEIVDEDELERLAARRLEPWARGPKSVWIRIGLLQITGRRLAEKGRYPH